MEFLYPSFLWALLALIVPIIIHLFYFRRFKKVAFTNVKFLKEIKEETASRRKLKNLLILLSRLLAVASLVFAFAQPYINTGNNIKKGSQSISIFIDNSASMQAELESTPLLEIAKARARDLVEAYGDSDQFQILTHDFEGQHQRLVGKEDALSFIDDVKDSKRVKTLQRVIDRQQQVLKGDNKVIYVLSDFQESITDFSAPIDTSLEVNLLPIQATQERNVSIDTAYFESPVPILNQNNNLVVKVTNHSNDPVERVKISYTSNGQTKPIGVVDIEANTTITDTVGVSILRTGQHEGIIKVTDFPVQFDDELYISYYVEEEIKVLSLNQGQPNRYLQALFDGISYFKLDNQDISRVQYQEFPSYDLILLNDLSNISSGLSNELKQYLNSGGKVIVFPQKGNDLSSYNSFLRSCGAVTLGDGQDQTLKVNKVNTADFVFQDVYLRLDRNLKLPSTTYNYSISRSSRTAQSTLLTYQNQSPYLSKNNIENGYLYVAASPLNQEYNDLVINAEVFVPMLYKMALAKATPSPLSYTIGRNNVISIPNSLSSAEEVFNIVGPSEFIPGINRYGKSIFLDMGGQVQQAGIYTIRQQDIDIKSLAYNYDRIESNLNLLEADDLESRFSEDNINVIDKNAQSQLGEYVEQKDQGITLWKWFLIAALVFLAFETLLIRMLRN